jgi:hypothetical protein
MTTLQLMVSLLLLTFLLLLASMPLLASSLAFWLVLAGTIDTLTPLFLACLQLLMYMMELLLLVFHFVADIHACMYCWPSMMTSPADLDVAGVPVGVAEIQLFVVLLLIQKSLLFASLLLLASLLFQLYILLLASMLLHAFFL